MKFLNVLACSLALCATPLVAQQLEVNDAAGSLTSNGLNPTVGSPFLVSSSETLNVEVGGNASAAYILVLGSLAASSTAVPGGEWFDLDISAPLVVLVDGINAGGSLFPFLSGNLNPFGTSDLSFPMSAANVGATYAMQAVTFDPLSMFNLNFTAAAEFNVVPFSLSPPVSASADDFLISYPLQNPICFAGGVFNEVRVDTNGFMRFGPTGISDFSELAADMTNGTVGGAPATSAIAMMWDDLRTDALSTSNLTVAEILPAVVQATWTDIVYFGTTVNLGTMVLTVDSSAGFTLVTMDYSALAIPAPANRGIVGLCSGPGATQVVMDLITGGVVNTLGSGVGATTIYQDFNAGGPIDVSGLVINAVDSTCDGSFVTF